MPDVPVRFAQHFEVARDPVGALMLGQPLYHREDPGSRNSNWQNVSVDECQVGRWTLGSWRVGLFGLDIIIVG